jgi:hypothetical protein
MHHPGALCNRLGVLVRKMLYYKADIGERHSSADESDMEWLGERQRHRLSAEDAARIKGLSRCIYIPRLRMS